MEIEQLKLILETLQGVGHEAGNLAVLYLWLHFVGGVLTNISIVGVFVGLFYFIYRAIRMSQGHDANDVFLREMRDQLNTGTGGHLTDHERQRTMSAIHALVAEKRAKGKA
jgi:hypothetical protein